MNILKSRLWIFALSLSFTFLAFTAFAQVVVIPPVTALPTTLTWDQLIGDIYGAIGGLKGATAYTIALFVVQGVVWLAESPLGTVAGKYTLLVVMILSLVSAEIAGLAAGMSWFAALMSGPVLLAAQVLAHQIYNQFILKSAETTPSTGANPVAVSA